MSRRGRVVLAVVSLAGVVRIVHLLAMHDAPLFAAHRIWPASDMYIFDQWAQRIVAGDPLGRTPYHPILAWMARIASPEQWTRWFGEAPAYFKAPLYAYLLAALRGTFGDPALPVFVLQIMASMASTALLFLVAEHLFGERAGLLAALVFALYGPAVHYDVVMLRGPWIVLGVLLVTWRLMRHDTRPTLGGAAVLGVIVGVCMLLRESLATLPFLVVLVFAASAGSVARWASASAAFVGGLGLALAPLVARNVAVGAPPLQLAVTGAWVLVLSNAKDSDPIFFSAPPESFVPIMEASAGRLSDAVGLCLRSFDGIADLGGFYLRRLAGLVAPLENPDNANFYYAAVRSPILRWLPDWSWVLPAVVVGMLIAIRHRPRGSLLALAPCVAALLMSNLVAWPLSRYRLPLLVLAMPFAGLALAALWNWVAHRRVAAVVAAAAVMVAVHASAGLVERRVVLADAQPWTHVYRLAEFYVSATEYERQGRDREASAEYLSLAAHLPAGSRQWVHALVLATPLLIRAGDRGGARTSLDTATPHAPAEPGVLIAIGDLYWKELDDPVAAAALYRRAGELRPVGTLLAILQARLRELEARAPTVSPPRGLR